MRLALFIACFNDLLHPRVGEATVAILERLGHVVEVPAGQTCCGQLHFNTGYRDEAAFDEFAKTLTWEGHAQNIRAPYLCVTGEFDALSPLQYTDSLFKVLAGPKVLVVYQGAGHAVSGVPSANLGPYFPTLMTDWLAARLAGKPVASERWWVDAGGRVERKLF